MGEVAVQRDICISQPRSPCVEGRKSSGGEVPIGSIRTVTLLLFYKKCPSGLLTFRRSAASYCCCCCLLVLLQEYADESRLKALVAKYSEFINFPIYLQTTTEKDVPVEEEEEAEKPAEEDKEGEDKEGEDKEEEQEEEKEGEHGDCLGVG